MLAWLTVAAPARAAKSPCPAQIAVKQTVASDYPGYQVSNRPSLHRLWIVEFYDGLPERLQLLRFTQEMHGKTSRNSPWTQRWEFAPGNASAIWVLCRYEETTITLSQRLNPETTQCSVSYKADTVRLYGSPAISSIHCD